MILKREVYFIQSGEGCRKKVMEYTLVLETLGVRRRSFTVILRVLDKFLQNSDRTLHHASFS